MAQHTESMDRQRPMKLAGLQHLCLAWAVSVCTKYVASFSTPRQIQLFSTFEIKSPWMIKILSFSLIRLYSKFCLIFSTHWTKAFEKASTFKLVLNQWDQMLY